MNTMMDYLQRAKFFRTKKRLGQNFLVNPEVIEDILDYAQITKEDIVLEIGPGVGFVTEQLVKHAKKVIADYVKTLFVNYTILLHYTTFFTILQ